VDALFNMKLRKVVEYMQFREFSSELKRKVPKRASRKSDKRAGSTGNVFLACPTAQAARVTQEIHSWLPPASRHSPPSIPHFFLFTSPHAHFT
jgi:hypothetical protein